MAQPSENKRVDSIRVRLSEEMMQRFEQLAKRYGMPPATLAAFAIARFVQAEESNAANARMAVLDATRRMGESMPEDAIEALISNGLAGMVKALQQPNLPLDGEEPGKGS